VATFDADKVRQWAQLLDTLDYFRVLALPRPPAGHAHADDVIRQAFLKAATSFHPDRYKDAPAAVRTDVDAIFRRVNEAYRVLRDPELRARYQLALGRGELRLPPDQLQRGSSSSIPAAKTPTPAPGPASDRPMLTPRRTGAIEAIIETQAALVFAQEADRALARGDLQKAKLQLQLALSKEPGNARILDALKRLQSSMPPPSRR
jgi:curved DNA-binding protein CbpA